MNVAIIPARGGSKRIACKNIRDFAGRPIIAYSIEAARNCDVFDHVIVSTDDIEIARLSKSLGAEVPFMRPAELADDFSSTQDVMAHAVNWVTNEIGTIRYACCLYPTAPFVRCNDLVFGLKLLDENKDACFAFSVTSFSFPIQRALSISEGVVKLFSPEHEFTRSQDLTEAYHDAGQFYWGRPDAFQTRKGVFSSHSLPVIIPRYLVQDIDTLEDWERAERMYAVNQMVAKKND